MTMSEPRKPGLLNPCPACKDKSSGLASSLRKALLARPSYPQLGGPLPLAPPNMALPFYETREQWRFCRISNALSRLRRHKR